MSGSAVFRALIRRELNARLLLALAVAAAAGFAAAGVAVQRKASNAEPSGLYDPILRFHTTMLLVAALLLLLRIAGRRHDDHEAGWLDPWCTAGGGRAVYSIGLWSSTLASMWLIFAAGAGSFALSVLALDGSTDLVLHMLSLLPGGAVMLAGVGAWGIAIAVLLRNAISSAVCSVFLIFGAYAAALFYLIASGGASLPPLLDVWLLRITPALQPPANLPRGMLQLAYTIAAGALAAGLSHWRVGRHA